MLLQEALVHSILHKSVVHKTCNKKGINTVSNHVYGNEIYFLCIIRFVRLTMTKGKSCILRLKKYCVPRTKTSKKNARTKPTT